MRINVTIPLMIMIMIMIHVYTCYSNCDFWRDNLPKSSLNTLCSNLFFNCYFFYCSKYFIAYGILYSCLLFKGSQCSCKECKYDKLIFTCNLYLLPSYLIISSYLK